VAASIGVLAMTAPVAWRRRAPLSAGAVLAGGALLNAALFGSMVRCGPSLPAVFLVAYAIGAQREQDWALLEMGFCATNVVSQAFFDPQLGPSVLPYMLPLVGAFYLFGRLARSRAIMVDKLQQQSTLLRRQREDTARLTTMADRARISAELDDVLCERIGHIAATADRGRAAVGADPEQARNALYSIEHEGRDVLRLMREIVGALHEEAPNEPQPTLADLAALLTESTLANASLTIEGEAHRLPAGVELSGYRIVEHFLQALADEPGASVGVRLCFAPEAVELHVTGPAATGVELGSILAAARERAALHRGTLDAKTEGDRCYASARLPLANVHA
jgi:signal transduction histidine kinase